MRKFGFACVSALALTAAAFTGNAHPLNGASTETAVVKAGCWEDCWHDEWRSHYRWGSNHNWHNRWRSHFRWGSYGGYYHDRWYSHNRWGSYHRYCCPHSFDDYGSPY